MFPFALIYCELCFYWIWNKLELWYFRMAKSPPTHCTVINRHVHIRTGDHIGSHQTYTVPFLVKFCYKMIVDSISIECSKSNFFLFPKPSQILNQATKVPGLMRRQTVWNSATSKNPTLSWWKAEFIGVAKSKIEEKITTAVLFWSQRESYSSYTNNA